MARYKDINNDSGVNSYEYNDNSIIVAFKKGGAYEYTNNSAGAAHIARMKALADAGDGLNSYINRYVKKGYSRRIN